MKSYSVRIVVTHKRELIKKFCKLADWNFSKKWWKLSNQVLKTDDWHDLIELIENKSGKKG